MAIGPVNSDGVVADQFATVSGNWTIVSGLDDGHQGTAQQVSLTLAPCTGAVFAEKSQRKHRLPAIRPRDRQGLSLFQVEVERCSIGHDAILSNCAHCASDIHPRTG